MPLSVSPHSFLDLDRVLIIATSLANVTSLTQEAQQMRNRLFAVSKCPRITGAGPGVPAYVSFARDVVNQLEDALQELSQQLQGLQDDQCLTSFPASILPDIGTLVVSLQAQTITLDRVWQDVNSTKYPILLSGTFMTIYNNEYIVYDNMQTRKIIFESHYLDALKQLNAFDDGPPASPVWRHLSGLCRSGSNPSDHHCVILLVMRLGRIPRTES